VDSTPRAYRLKAGNADLPISTSLGTFPPYIARAITGGRVLWGSQAGMRTVIEFYNDNSHSFVNVMEILAEAEADAVVGRLGKQ